MIFKFLIALGIASFICSCGPNYETQVTRFHKLPATGAGETFTVFAPRLGNGIEVNQNLSGLSSGLVTHGWKQVKSKNSTYKVAVDYGIIGKRTIHGSTPIVGLTGGGTTYSSGTMS